MKASLLRTWILLDSSGRVTNQVVKRKDKPRAGAWIEVTGGCCQADQLSAPDAPTPSSVTSSGFTVNTTAVDGADYYIVQRATNSGFTAGKNTQIISGATLAYTGLTTATHYYVRYMAVDTTGALKPSGWSETLDVLTA